MDKSLLTKILAGGAAVLAGTALFLGKDDSKKEIPTLDAVRPILSKVVGDSLPKTYSDVTCSSAAVGGLSPYDLALTLLNAATCTDEVRDSAGHVVIRTCPQSPIFKEVEPALRAGGCTITESNKTAKKSAPIAKAAASAEVGVSSSGLAPGCVADRDNAVYVEDCGALADDATDACQAFSDAFAVARVVKARGKYWTSCSISVPSYKVLSGGGWTLSRIRSPRGAPTIILNGTRSTVEDVYVYQWPSTSTVSSAAVVIRGHGAAINKVWSQKAQGHCFEVDGTGGNANNWWINDSLGSECIGGSALYTHGSDANAGYATNFEAVNADRYGIEEMSFLGNLYNGGKLASNTLGAITVKPTDPGSNKSTFVGIYVEGCSGTCDDVTATWPVMVVNSRGVGYLSATYLDAQNQGLYTYRVQVEELKFGPGSGVLYSRLRHANLAQLPVVNSNCSSSDKGVCILVDDVASVGTHRRCCEKNNYPGGTGQAWRDEP